MYCSNTDLCLSGIASSIAPLRDLLDRLETELLDLQHSGVLKDLAIDLETVKKAPRAIARPQPRRTAASPSLQTELHFSD